MKRKLTTLIIALMLILSACEFPPATEEPAPDPAPAVEEPAPEVVETEPETEEVEESEPADEPEVVETEEPTEEEVITCLELLEPLNGSEFPGNARVIFSWSAHPDADSYSLNFIFPDGLELSFAIDETTTARYMSGFSMHPAYNQNGAHQWNVSVLNAAGEELCQSDTFTFTKALSDGVGEESAPQDNGDDGGGGEPSGPSGGNTGGGNGGG